MPPFDALPPRRTGNANRAALCRKWVTGCADNAGSIRCGPPVRQARNARKTCGGQCRHGRSGNKARLRPLFDAFAAKFPPVANDAMPFGIWLHLHSQDRAPSADDVPPGNTLSISEFLQDYKRRQTVEYRMQREAPLLVRKNSGNPCRSVGEILKGMGATLCGENAFSAPDLPITAYT